MASERREWMAKTSPRLFGESLCGTLFGFHLWSKKKRRKSWLEKGVVYSLIDGFNKRWNELWFMGICRHPPPPPKMNWILQQCLSTLINEFFAAQFGDNLLIASVMGMLILRLIIIIRREAYINTCLHNMGCKLQRVWSDYSNTRLQFAILHSIKCWKNSDLLWVGGK